MTQTKQINESLALAIEIEFETLGNVIANYLLSIELKTIEKITTASHAEQVSCLVDSYAKQLDKILNKYKDDITKDIKELTEYLSVDLKKLAQT